MALFKRVRLAPLAGPLWPYKIGLTNRRYVPKKTSTKDRCRAIGAGLIAVLQLAGLFIAGLLLRDAVAGSRRLIRESASCHSYFPRR